MTTTQIIELQTLLGTTPIDGVFGVGTELAVRSFQKKYGLVVDGVAGPKTFALLRSRLALLGAEKNFLLSKGQFYEERTQKKGVCIHHTVSNGNIANVVAGWDNDARRVGTPFVIGHKGELTECFPYWFWAHHLGLEHPNNTQLNKDLIGIEICSYGSLEYKNGIFYNTYGGIVQEEEVIELPKNHKGYHYYHAYKKESIDKLGDLLLNLKTIHEFDSHKVEVNFDWFQYDSTKKTTKNLHWLNTHGQFRRDKNDCYPDPYLIQVLNQIL